MKKIIFSLAAAITLWALSSAMALAQFTSPNYKVEEYLFGAGGELDSTSPNYQAQTSVGALGVNSTSSSSYSAYSGFLTANEPFLELGIDSTLVDLGTLDASSTKTGVASFH